MVFVYISKSLTDQGYYIGVTKELGSRLAKHNAGRVYSTKRRAPFKLIYSEEYIDYQSAREREKEIKSYKGGNKFKSLIV